MWEDVNLSFASKVLAFPCPSQRSRSRYDKLLHEQHWTICHNSGQEAKTVTARMALLNRSLYQSYDDRRNGDKGDHVIHLFPLRAVDQCSLASDAVLTSHPLSSKLHTRPVPKVLVLAHSPEGPLATGT